MTYTNSQLAFYVAKKTNNLRDAVIVATNALNTIHAELNENSNFESIVNGCDIVMLNDSRAIPMDIIISISQPTVGEKYEAALIIDYDVKESLVLPINQIISTTDIANWLLFHFEVTTMWDIYTED